MSSHILHVQSVQHTTPRKQINPSSRNPSTTPVNNHTPVSNNTPVSITQSLSGQKENQNVSNDIEKIPTHRIPLTEKALVGKNGSSLLSGAQRVAVRVGITSNIDSTSKSIQKNIKDKNNSSRSYMQTTEAYRNACTPTPTKSTTIPSISSLVSPHSSNKQKTSPLVLFPEGTHDANINNPNTNNSSPSTQPSIAITKPLVTSTIQSSLSPSSNLTVGITTPQRQQRNASSSIMNTPPSVTQASKKQINPHTPTRHTHSTEIIRNTTPTRTPQRSHNSKLNVASDQSKNITGFSSNVYPDLGYSIADIDIKSTPNRSPSINKRTSISTPPSARKAQSLVPKHSKNESNIEKHTTIPSNTSTNVKSGVKGRSPARNNSTLHKSQIPKSLLKPTVSTISGVYGYVQPNIAQDNKSTTSSSPLKKKKQQIPTYTGHQLKNNSTLKPGKLGHRTQQVQNITGTSKNMSLFRSSTSSLLSFPTPPVHPPEFITNKRVTESLSLIDHDISDYAIDGNEDKNRQSIDSESNNNNNNNAIMRRSYSFDSNLSPVRKGYGNETNDEDEATDADISFNTLISECTIGTYEGSEIAISSSLTGSLSCYIKNIELNENRTRAFSFGENNGSAFTKAKSGRSLLIDTTGKVKTESINKSVSDVVAYVSLAPSCNTSPIPSFDCEDGSELINISAVDGCLSPSPKSMVSLSSLWTQGTVNTVNSELNKAMIMYSECDSPHTVGTISQNHSFISNNSYSPKILIGESSLNNSKKETNNNINNLRINTNCVNIKDNVYINESPSSISLHSTSLLSEISCQTNDNNLDICSLPSPIVRTNKSSFNQQNIQSKIDINSKILNNTNLNNSSSSSKKGIFAPPYEVNVNSYKSKFLYINPNPSLYLENPNNNDFNDLDLISPLTVPDTPNILDRAMFQDDIDDCESYDEDAIRSDNIIIISSNDNSQDLNSMTASLIQTNVTKNDYNQESIYNSNNYKKFDDINYLLDHSHDNSSIVDSSLSVTVSHVTLNYDDPNFDSFSLIAGTLCQANSYNLNDMSPSFSMTFESGIVVDSLDKIMDDGCWIEKDISSAFISDDIVEASSSFSFSNEIISTSNTREEDIDPVAKQLQLSTSMSDDIYSFRSVYNNE